MMKGCRVMVVLLGLWFVFGLSVPGGRTEAASPRANDAPIVLLHGFTGWGREEMFGFKYWGGVRGDIEQWLNDNGYQAYTLAVGPLSSNWDRACEAYAQLVGGTVDYGAAHAAKHGHARFGRTYPGLLPELKRGGRIHIIAHSQGGQTARMLVSLLENGSQEEREYAKEHNVSLSPLFEGGHRFVLSVTTIATPHDGTTLVNMVDFTDRFFDLQKAVLEAAAVASNAPYTSEIYDFKLDQWGLRREPGESFDHYFERLKRSPVWTSTDTARYDLSVPGAETLNRWVKASPNTYYLSFSTERTYRGALTGNYYPELGMNAFSAIVCAPFLGSYRNAALGIDSHWLENDGIVNTISMNGPKRGSNDRIVPYDGTLKKGVWNDMGTCNVDHLEVIGVDPNPSFNIRAFYLRLAEQLASLRP
ncbi:lipase [Geobacillus sp. GHH01]|nr:lipase [Geobacillus sp. GHH01]AFU07645.1 lipase [Geobacillus sp. GHH01]AGE22568.1 lipase [Geobacillus sp. GHH01]